MAERMCVELNGTPLQSNTAASAFAVTGTATNGLNSTDLEFDRCQSFAATTPPDPQNSAVSSGLPLRAVPIANNMRAATEVEELLNSAFQELEKERATRIALETKLRALQESSLVDSLCPGQASPRRKSSKSSSPTKQQTKHRQKEDGGLPQEYTRTKACALLQQELEDYRQIVDVMTQEKPAIAAAMRATHERRLAVRTGRPISPNYCPTLPLHVVQMLEVMPWEVKAQEHAFATEEMYEWQVYNLKQRKWTTEKKHFPSFFRKLCTLDTTMNNYQERDQPVDCSSSDSFKQPGRCRSMLMFLAGCERIGTSAKSNVFGSGSSASLTVPPKTSILTDGNLNHLVCLNNGVTLPDDGGTWQWVGCWRIEKRVIVYAGSGGEGRDNKEHRQTSLDCDEEGWSYAMDAIDFLREHPEEICHDHPGTVQDRVTLEKATFLSGNQVIRHMVPLRKVRRRKWSRRRVLIDYPFASEQSRQFLKQMAQNASLTVAANRISDQLVETKMELTNTQLKTHQNEEDTRQKIQQLKQEIVLREERIHKLQQKRALEKIRQGTPPPKWSALPRESTKPGRCSTRKERNDSSAESVQNRKVLQNMITSWMVPSSGQKRDYSDDDEVSDGSRSGDASFSSSEEPPADIKNADNSMNTETCRRYSVSSTSSEKSSFDWKKLGREAMETIKHRRASAVNKPQLWLNTGGTKRGLQGDDASCSSRSASPSSEFLQSEVSVSIE